MSGSQKPLIKEPIQVFTTHLFKCQAQLMEFCRFELICSQVQINSLEESLISEVIAQHMQNTSPFIVGMTIKHLLFIFIIKPDQVMISCALCTLIIAFSLTISLIIGLIQSKTELIPQVLTVISERLIQW